MNTPNTVVPFPAKAEDSAPGNFEKIWGKKVKAHGYAAIPSIMVRAHRRLGINTTQFCILVQLLEYLRSPDRAPFPTKKQLADRIGIEPSTIKANMQALEKAGFIERKQHKTAAGDWGANTYVLDGLIAKIKALEPDFTKEREEKEQARKKAETPRGRLPKAKGQAKD